jgi:hypothetical protein
MPRPLRIEYEGALYHVMSRGDRREAIFLEDADRDGFLHTLGEACAKTAWQVHAYCLMSNHFHLVVETPRPNLRWTGGVSPQDREWVPSRASTQSASHILGLDDRPFLLGEGCDLED